MPDNFTGEALIAKVRELADTNPDFVYPSSDGPGDGSGCWYVPDERQPGCIFGQAFIALGVEVEFLARHEGGACQDVAEDAGFLFEGDQPEWCAAVQANQDMGRRWAEAVETGDHRFPSVARR